MKPSTVGDHRSPNRWIAKIIAAIALDRSSGGTARKPIALTRDVDRHKPSSARNAAAKNVHGVGMRNAAAANGVAHTMPIAQMRSSALTPRLLIGSSNAVSTLTGW